LWNIERAEAHRGVKNVSINESHFQDIFRDSRSCRDVDPSNPWRKPEDCSCWLEIPDRDKKLLYFRRGWMTHDSGGPVVPGDQLRWNEVLSWRGDFCKTRRKSDGGRAIGGRSDADVQDLDREPATKAEEPPK